VLLLNFITWAGAIRLKPEKSPGLLKTLSILLKDNHRELLQSKTGSYIILYKISDHVLNLSLHSVPKELLLDKNQNNFRSLEIP